MKKYIFFIAVLTFISLSTKAQTIPGIDVSQWNGTIDWLQVKSGGNVFAFARATDGISITDYAFQTNMVNGTSAGVIMGAYHFAQPSASAAIAQAQYFVSVADSFIGQGFLPPVLDIETISGMTFAALSAWAEDWLTEVKTLTGISPIIYTGTNFAANLNSSLNTYGLWIAQWNGGTNPPTNIGVWNDWLFKQYTSLGIVPGISGQVNLNIFNGDSAALNNLIGISNAGISEESSVDIFIIYPNPAGDNISIEITSLNITADEILAIYVLQGQLLLQQPISQIQANIDISAFAKGMYFVNVKTENGSMIKKFIKE